MTKESFAQHWAEITDTPAVEPRIRMRKLSEAGLLPNRAIGPKNQPLNYFEMAWAILGMVSTETHTEAPEAARRFYDLRWVQDRNGELFFTDVKLGDVIAASFDLKDTIIPIKIQISLPYSYCQMEIATSDTYNPQTGYMDGQPDGQILFGAHGLLLPISPLERMNIVHIRLLRRLLELEKPVPPPGWMKFKADTFAAKLTAATQRAA